MARNQKGSSLLVVIMGIAIVAIAIFAGYSISRRESTHQNIATPNTKSSQKKYPYYTPAQVAAYAPLNTSTWQTAQLKDPWFTYRYPSDWKFYDPIGPTKRQPEGKTFATYTTYVTANGDSQTDYGMSQQVRGEQIEVTVTNSADGPIHPVADCSKDLPYYLLKTSTGLDGENQCLVQGRQDQYEYDFDVNKNQINLRLTLGSSNDAVEDQAALQTLIGMAGTFHITSNP